MLLTLDELCTQVALALSTDYAGAPNERVRDVPDRRTVRYYTTLGLIDRPAQLRGRTALYGRRHLLQLVAIKRLQANGLSLSEVQQRLYGQTDAELEPIAQLPPSSACPAAEPESPTMPRREFWKEAPADVDEPAEAPLVPTIVQGVPLDDRVVMLLPLRRSPDAGDLEAIRVAAEPLLQLLRRRRLTD